MRLNMAFYGVALLGSLPLSVALAAEDEHFQEVIDRAEELAATPYSAPEDTLPQALHDISYDTYRQIRFDPEKAYWKDESDINLQLFHSGFLFTTPVTLNVIDGDDVSTLPFSADDYRYDGDAAPLADEEFGDIGHAGFRLHYPLNEHENEYADEFAVFLGSNYFRLVGEGQVYGLSTRGLAVNTAQADQEEEFPAFREFWLYKPGEEAGQITLLALLDSPSITGAYRFVLTPGESTVAEVEAELFAREDIAKLGVAPLTSMFTFGDTTQAPYDDFRPLVHDSDGLLINNGQDEWIWRPLHNPEALRVSSFTDSDPKGFGLMQRERDFNRYLDLEANYHRRPSQWVQPLEQWGPGHVELVEIPTPDETHDNIVAYWVSEDAMSAGEHRRLHYRTFTLNESPNASQLAQVVRTRHGQAIVPGDEGEESSEQRQIIVDFEGPSLSGLSADMPPELAIENQGGEIALPQVKPLPDGGWRATFRILPGDAPSDIRLHLTHDDKAVSETWNYVWYPSDE